MGATLGEIDPTWWSAVFATDGVEEYEPPELLSSRLEQLLKQDDLPPREREVIGVLAAVTSAMLQPDSWLDPFRPAVVWGGRRSLIPSDLKAEQWRLLAELAPLIEQPVLRARVADVAWFYGDRSQVWLLEMAIDAYRSIPITDTAWPDVGRASWTRAYELAVRSGAVGKSRVEEMNDALTFSILATQTPGYRVGEYAAMAREYGRWGDATRREIAEHLVRLAGEPAAALRVSRHLEREAAHWFGTANPQARSECLERAARTYIAEADARIAADPQSGTLVEGHFLEKAIAGLRILPKKYRLAHGIDVEIATLRERLRDSRELSLEQMMRIETDPVDLSEAVAYARGRVAGHESAWAALAMFASLMPPIDADKTRQTAADLVDGSLSQIFPSVTYSHDARKVAARAGRDANGNDEGAWSEIVRTVSFHAQLVATGMILPAQQVLVFEHAFSRALMIRICSESPVVPSGHEHLWAAGLALGLDGDYGPAVAILIPQLEQAVRVTLKTRGAHTLFVDDETGVESEKSLSALLDMPEASEAFGGGMVLEWKALLIEQSGVNLRNDIAHGLLTDGAAWSTSAAFAWWSCLRLVVWTLWTMSQTQPNGESPGG